MTSSNFTKNNFSFEGYPAKYNKLIFLKNGETGLYSDWGSRIGSIDQESYPEDRFDYPIQPIDKISFIKKGQSSNFAYLPFISQFHGIGYYKLKKGKDYILFKEIAYKEPFQFFKTASHTIHYTLPTKFKLKTEVSFVKYAPQTNQNEPNSQGIYVVRKNRAQINF